MEAGSWRRVSVRNALSFEHCTPPLPVNVQLTSAPPNAWNWEYSTALSQTNSASPSVSLLPSPLHVPSYCLRECTTLSGFDSLALLPPSRVCALQTAQQRYPTDGFSRLPPPCVCTLQAAHQR